jgi:hypothetical protein
MVKKVNNLKKRNSVNKEISKKPVRPNKKVMIIISIIIAIALIGLIFSFVSKPNVSLRNLTPEEKILWQFVLDNKNNPEYDARTLSVAIEFAFKKNDPSVCDVLREEFKDKCILITAEKLNNIEVCDNSKDLSNKIDCYEKLILMSGKTEDCEKLNENKAICYVNIALNKSDSSLCDKAGGDFGGLCNAVLSKDITICQGLNDSDYKLGCIAILTNNVSECKNIQYKNIIINSDECYHYFAGLPSSSEYCNYINNNNLKTKCIDSLSTAKNESPFLVSISDKTIDLNNFKTIIQG